MKSSRNNSLRRSVVAFVLFNSIWLTSGAFTETKSPNISTNWTLPQEGFGVFYRFFRDKISWFEADAVCQFHHGNLVTVNNGIQFDSTRAFLRELDVLNTVWIGLKGASGSSQFFWANSLPLDFNAGYWAESFPATENQLCAAIDPSRNYRWHALNCNGPATSAFLCELPVPEWAKHCTTTAMPSVTIQYLSDAAAIRLTRDCGDDQGERHVLCHAGEDRASILSQLVCSNNNASPSTTTEEVLHETTSTSPSDEDESTSSSTTESSVASAINKIVTEIQSIATNDSLNGELESVVKPRKPLLEKSKKYIPLEKKFKRIQLEKEQRTATSAAAATTTSKRSIMQEKEAEEKEVDVDLEQTVTGGDELDNLPRIKKMRAEDLKHPEEEEEEKLNVKEERVRRETLNIPLSTEAAADVVVEESTQGEEETDAVTASTTTLMDEDNLTANFTEDVLTSNILDGEDEIRNWTQPDGDSDSNGTDTLLLSVPHRPEMDNMERTATPHSAQPKGSITHPMHISSDMTKELLEAVDEKMQKNNKKILANHQDHFVPPMLLVKAKFTPGKQHIDAQENLTTFDGNASNHVDNSQPGIESPLSEAAANDISKFYPASTEKPSVHHEEVTKVEDRKEDKSTIPPISTAIYNNNNEMSNGDIIASISSTAEPVGSADASEPIKYTSEFTFSNIENYKPYRPNRRRILTKPESHSYLRKILGRH